MSVDAALVRRLAADGGSVPETLEKVVRLGQVLADVGRHPYLRERLALKGGTALNLLFPAPPRLSVDLDFNYVGSVERETMLRERPPGHQLAHWLKRGGDRDGRTMMLVASRSPNGSSSASKTSISSAPSGSRSGGRLRRLFRAASRVPAP